jgi:hypothetical protein
VGGKFEAAVASPLPFGGIDFKLNCTSENEFVLRTNAAADADDQSQPDMEVKL